MVDTAECPYCEHENDMTGALCEGVPDDGIFDWECYKCGKEFEVFVEFYPIYSTSEIVYTDCDACGGSTRDIHKRGSIFPFPKSLEDQQVCKECFLKHLVAELDQIK